MLRDEEIVEHQHLFSVHFVEERLRGRSHQHVAVQAEVLRDVLTMVGVIPVNAGVPEEDAVLKALSGRDRVLRDPGHTVVAVLEPDAVPVDRGGPFGVIRNVHRYRGILFDLDERPRVLAIEPVHHVGMPADRSTDFGSLEVERLSIAKPDELARPSQRTVSRVATIGAGQKGRGFGAKVLEAWDHRDQRMHRWMRPR